MRFLPDLRPALNRWARKRQGTDPDPVVLSTRRIYILPTALGLVYGLMIVLMMLGSMNYGNNLALGLTFLLGALGMVGMHHCQRTLAGLRIVSAGSEAIFAGQQAHFRFMLENVSPQPRFELQLSNEHSKSEPVALPAGARGEREVTVPAPRRGLLKLDRFEVSTRYPFGLFRAWSILHMESPCVVYPRPSEPGKTPPPMQTDTGGAQDQQRGDEDFAGLRAYHPGDSSRRIAWKAYARGQELHVKQYAGTAVVSHILDWDSLAGLDVEARLSRLCRWVEDAHANDRAYGLKIPGVEIEPNMGRSHRQRCLTALALFGTSTP